MDRRGGAEMFPGGHTPAIYLVTRDTRGDDCLPFPFFLLFRFLPEMSGSVSGIVWDVRPGRIMCYDALGTLAEFFFFFFFGHYLAQTPLSYINTGDRRGSETAG